MPRRSPTSLEVAIPASHVDSSDDFFDPLGAAVSMLDGQQSGGHLEVMSSSNIIELFLLWSNESTGFRPLWAGRLGENFQANQPELWQNTHYLMHDALCCITAEAKSNVNWDFEVSKSYNKEELRDKLCDASFAMVDKWISAGWSCGGARLTGALKTSLEHTGGEVEVLGFANANEEKKRCSKLTAACMFARTAQIRKNSEMLDLWKRLLSVVKWPFGTDKKGCELQLLAELEDAPPEDLAELEELEDVPPEEELAELEELEEPSRPRAKAAKPWKNRYPGLRPRGLRPSPRTPAADTQRSKAQAQSAEAVEEDWDEVLENEEVWSNDWHEDDLSTQSDGELRDNQKGKGRKGQGKGARRTIGKGKKGKGKGMPAFRRLYAWRSGPSSKGWSNSKGGKSSEGWSSRRKW